jgi:hypothetical protein
VWRGHSSRGGRPDPATARWAEWGHHVPMKGGCTAHVTPAGCSRHDCCCGSSAAKIVALAGSNVL